MGVSSQNIIKVNLVFKKMSPLYLWPKERFIGSLYLNYIENHNFFIGLTELPTLKVSFTELVDYFVNDHRIKTSIYTEKILFRIYGVGERIFSLFTGQDDLYKYLVDKKKLRMITTQWYTWNVESSIKFTKRIYEFLKFLFSYSNIIQFPVFPGFISPKYKTVISKIKGLIYGNPISLTYNLSFLNNIIQENNTKLILCGLNVFGYIKNTAFKYNLGKLIANEITYSICGYDRVLPIKDIDYISLKDYLDVISRYLNRIKKAGQILLPYIDLKTRIIYIINLSSEKCEVIEYYDGLIIDTEFGKLKVDIDLTQLLISYKLPSFTFLIGIKVPGSTFSNKYKKITVYYNSKLLMDGGSENNVIIFDKIDSLIKRL